MRRRRHTRTYRLLTILATISILTLTTPVLAQGTCTAENCLSVDVPPSQFAKDYESPGDLRLDANGDARFSRGGSTTRYIRIGWDGASGIIDAFDSPLLLNYYARTDVAIGRIDSGAPSNLVVSGNMSVGSGLQPGFALAVNGRVRAKDVRVEVGWSDYVFDADYSLPSIENVEQFIDENGHLPGVPSSAEISEDGLALGEMQAVLMRKIEELTLYVIQLKNENRMLRGDCARRTPSTHSTETTSSPEH